MPLCAPESEPHPWRLSGTRKGLAGSLEARRLRKPESVFWVPCSSPPAAGLRPGGGHVLLGVGGG